MPSIDFNLYLVTDRRATAGRDLSRLIEEALEGGVKAVQLREKDLEGRELFELAARLKRLCDRYAAELFINDRVDVAMATGSHVHLPANSLPAEIVRGLVGTKVKIGVSTHRLGEAEAAARSGADFVLFGPVYTTPSKVQYGAPQGVAALRQIAARVPLPVFAIGGIGLEQIPELRACGVERIALISAILTAPDPRAAARDILRALG